MKIKIGDIVIVLVVIIGAILLFCLNFPNGNTVVVEIDGKDYAVYKMLDDDGTVSTYASYVVQDEDGYDVLKDIDNPKDKSKITAFVRKNGY